MAFYNVKNMKKPKGYITLLHFDEDFIGNYDGYITDEEGNEWRRTGTDNPYIIMPPNNPVKFGAGSLGFNNTNTPYTRLKSPVISGLNFGAKDFTIDFWLCALPQDITEACIIYGNNIGLRLSLINADTDNYLKLYYSSDNSSWYSITSGAIDISYLGAWHHVAIVRNGDYIKLYIDGTQEAAGYLGMNWTPYYNNGNLIFGCEGEWGQTQPLKISAIDEFRIVDYAAWTSNFIPPTEPYN